MRAVAPEAGCFLLVAAVYIAYFLIWGDTRFYFDSAGYWNRADRFERDGDFSLMSYDDRVRGYSLPLFNYGLKAVASTMDVGSVTIVELAGALLAATLGVVLLPRLARLLFSEAAVSWGRVLALNSLVFLFWRGHLNYPLSDFPAVVGTAIGLLGLLRGTKLGYLVAGLGLGLAANIRPAFVPVVLVAVLAAAFVPLGSWSMLRRGVSVSVVLAGALLVSMPQMLINHHQRGSWSPLIPVARELTLDRFTAGLLVQRTETYVGPRGQYPEPLVFYLDPIGIRVHDEERVSTITGYGEYLNIVLHHPILMTASYGLHTFNGFDIRYATPYVKNLEDTSVALSFLDYTILFAAIIRLVLPAARRRLGEIWWLGLLVLVVPTLTAISSAVEPRYFLPVHMLVYMLVCFGPATVASLFAGPATRRIGLTAAYATFLVLSFTLSASVSSQIEHPIAADAWRGVF